MPFIVLDAPHILSEAGNMKFIYRTRWDFSIPYTLHIKPSTSGNITIPHPRESIARGEDAVRGVLHVTFSPRTSSDLQIALPDIQRSPINRNDIHNSDQHIQSIHTSKIDIIDIENPPPGTSTTYHTRTDSHTSA
jgi:hypothetical protein